MKFRNYAVAGLVLGALLGGCSPSGVFNADTLRPPISSPPPPSPSSYFPARQPPQAVGRGEPLSQQMVAFHDSGQMLQAIGAANRVIKNGGASVAKAYYIRGSAEGQMREFDLAVEDLRKATQKAPEDGMAWFTRAWYEYEAGDVRQAISTGETAAKLNPKLSMVWLNLGLCYAVDNQIAKSKRCYEAGRTLADRGVIGEAIRDIDNARQRYPKSEKSLALATKWLTGD